MPILATSCSKNNYPEVIELTIFVENCIVSIQFSFYSVTVKIKKMICKNEIQLHCVTVMGLPLNQNPYFEGLAISTFGRWLYGFINIQSVSIY